MDPSKASNALVATVSFYADALAEANREAEGAIRALDLLAEKADSLLKQYEGEDLKEHPYANEVRALRNVLANMRLPRAKFEP